MIFEIGGTSDGISIAKQVQDRGWPVLLSVTTSYGKNLAQQAGISKVRVGKLDQSGMEKLVQDLDVDLILDASHPFAGEVSKTAIQAGKNQDTPYIRYERPEKDLEGATYVHSIPEACYKAQEVLTKSPGGKIYLTVGSKTLADYLTYLDKDFLVARVLPRAEAMEACQDLGLGLNQVEGLMGPFTMDMNRALIRNNRAVCLVSKESGKRGGLPEKLAACQAEGIPCIIIRRPQISYPKLCSSFACLFQEIEDLLGPGQKRAGEGKGGEK